MKYLKSLLFIGTVLFTACNSETSDSNVSPTIDFSGTYEGQLTSNDDDQMNDLIEVRIIDKTDRYELFFYDQGSPVLQTEVVEQNGTLYFEEKEVQTIDENEVLTLEYSIEYIDEMNLDLKMQYSYQFENEVYTSSARLIRK